MSISFALLIIAILLVYDFLFLRLLIKRRQREKFAIYIEQGQISKTSGKIPAQLLAEIRQACQQFSPALVKIYRLEQKNTHQLIISGSTDERFNAQINEKYQLIYRD